jgi:hypothetical protein
MNAMLIALLVIAGVSGVAGIATINKSEGLTWTLLSTMTGSILAALLVVAGS